MQLCVCFLNTIIIIFWDCKSFAVTSSQSRIIIKSPCNSSFWINQSSMSITGNDLGNDSKKCFFCNQIQIFGPTKPVRIILFCENCFSSKRVHSKPPLCGRHLLLVISADSIMGKVPSMSTKFRFTVGLSQRDMLFTVLTGFISQSVSSK